jgi:hypothetical protein
LGVDAVGQLLTHHQKTRNAKKPNTKPQKSDGSEREAGHHRHHREETTIMVWLSQKNARGENKIRTSKKTWKAGVQAALTTRDLEPDQWRNREEWRLVCGRW